MRKKIIASVMAALCIGSSIAYADTGTAHIKIGSISGGASNISYWYDTSVSSYGQNGAVDNARSQWDSISSGIGWSAGTQSSAKMKVFAGYQALPGGTYGQTSYYNYNWYGGVDQVYSDDVTNGSSYDQAQVILDAGWTSSWSQSERWMNAGHEVGHVLGMNHFENSPEHAGSHWMKSGRYTLTTPTEIDIAHMRTKWGY
ncbi:hypothetical protein [Paenibacillus durus]|uniref:Peptidase M10 metallopeptidase domain-containing protein n=1 Tax=Paenibacillus durus TaxID=44251 RepID=A0A089HKG8_PAEDU|nr:hypothetical protein [Paenibacillus durus]AIQ11607.1 hypothetical protein PDUR_06335 [Paenibacillus durus]